MEQFQWIMSEGGPLICMETPLASHWGGNTALTVKAGEAKDDYERAGQVYNYAKLLPLKDGQALVFGEGPLNTSFWRSADGPLFLVRISCCEEGVDFGAIMGRLGADIFDNPRESLDLDVRPPELIVFDSAWEGYAPDKKSISHAIEPGRYRILTKPYDPDPSCSLVLHRFDRLP